MGIPLVALVLAASINLVRGQADNCKCYKGDSCWPDDAAWATLNETAGGSLQLVYPPGAPCYQSFNDQPSYDQQQCSTATQNWSNADWLVDDPMAPMWPFYSNNTCDPKADASSSVCTLGYLPEYVIVATTAEQVQAGVKFAHENNIRVVIRNSGHDFMGRSTGFGALGINTHRFDTIEFEENYTGPEDWTGGAVTIGAGVMHRELYEAAFQQSPPVVVVGGECPTVAVAGGYIQGGGHGPMAGYYGLAADNALAFEVVTADGELVTADLTHNSDLFWALKGGGPGAFGVVISATLKAFPEVSSVGMTLSIMGSGDGFWKGVADFHNMANSYTEAGMYVWFALSNGMLTVRPFVGPNMARTEFESVINPLLEQLTSDGVSFTNEIKEFPTFYELYQGMFDFTHDAGGNQMLVGGRLFTADDIEDYGDDIVAAMRTVIEGGASFGGHILNPGFANPTIDNPVHPAWRMAAAANLYMVAAPATNTLAERKALEDQVTSLGQVLRDAGPNSASYVNEGDINEPNWQEAYWGSHNYDQLIQVKQTWDFDNVFYTKSTAGSENWEETDGRLCKVATS